MYRRVELTVFVIDDDEGARESLTFLMRTEGLTCRGYASASAFLNQLRPEHQGCIVTDVRMPEMDGIALVHHLRDRGCRIPVVVITGHADVPLAVKAMKAGVSDFIEKPFESNTILTAVRHGLEQAHETGVNQSRRATVERRMASLTERERQVFAALFEGQSNKEIAISLDISPRPVEIYRANVMSKMQADSLSSLVKMMIVAKADS